MSGSGRWIVVAVVVGSMMTGGGVAFAKAPWVKQVKDAGLPAKNCMYCHTDKLPKKDTFKPDKLDERGTWLLAEKKRRGATEVDPKWLKEYPGDREQK